MKVRKLPLEILYKLSRQDAILLALAMSGPMTRDEIAKAIEEMTGIKMKVVYLHRMMPALTRDGYIRICCKRGKKYVYEITPMGIRLLRRLGLVR